MLKMDVECHLEQHHPTRDEIDRVVAQLYPRQRRDERGVGVEEFHVREDDAGNERAADVADLDRPGHGPLDALLAMRARSERPACVPTSPLSAPRKQARSPTSDQSATRVSAGHQKACPTASCSTRRRQNDLRVSAGG